VNLPGAGVTGAQCYQRAVEVQIVSVAHRQPTVAKLQGREERVVRAKLPVAGEVDHVCGGRVLTQSLDGYILVQQRDCFRKQKASVQSKNWDWQMTLLGQMDHHEACALETGSDCRPVAKALPGPPQHFLGRLSVELLVKFLDLSGRQN